jgi:hypothetical protein
MAFGGWFIFSYLGNMEMDGKRRDPNPFYGI